MSSIELNPCPFCGSKPIVDIDISTKNGEWSAYCLGCFRCSVIAGSCEEAISRWNTRHYPPEVMQAMEYLKKKKR